MGWQDDAIVSNGGGWKSDPVVSGRNQDGENASNLKALRQERVNELGGAIRGAGSIGATLMGGFDMAEDAIERLVTGKPTGQTRNEKRRQAIDDGLTSLISSDPTSTRYQVAKGGTEVLGTLGLGPAAAAAVTNAAPRVAAAVPSFVEAVRTGGATAGAGGIVPRVVGGGATGFGAASLVDPKNAVQGGAIGAAMPVATKVAGMAGNMAGDAVRATGRAIVGKVSPEVVALAKRAEQLGIKIPADRIADSKPLNAAAASLSYAPFSGREATEEAMFKSMNRALSRTFGQDSDNVTMALRKAGGVLGDKFDEVLKGNTVKMTPKFREALAAVEDQATNELGPEAGAIIRNQIAQLQTKGAAGAIDGQAAYNIKKALDRIGRGNSDAAFYARELKRTLMDALNDSLGPQQAEAFGKLRGQYSNMLSLENLAQNGAEGGVSVARLANLKHINNPELQELADIAAQFLRSRESAHGAMQRLVIGGVGTAAAGGAGALPLIPIVGAGVRATNMLLNSNAARNAVMGVKGPPNALMQALENSELTRLGYLGAPSALSGR